MKKPLISICIPTYNRADYLEKCISAIIEQKGFEKIQVVISDNCSTDNTEHIGNRFQGQYDNIKYFRNEENVGDENFALALRRGDGLLRKLTNDSVIYKSGAIEYMIDLVLKNEISRPQLFFLSSGKQNKEIIEVDTLEEYISQLGYHLTWIASIAVWEDDCDDLKIMTDNSQTNLGQIPFLLNNFEKHNKAVISDKPIMITQSKGKKDISYGLYNVFYNNFLGHIKPYCDSEKISTECYEELRKDLLMEFFCIWLVKLEEDRDRYITSDENLRELLDKEYKNEDYYGEFKRALRKKKIKQAIKKFL